MKQTQFYSRHLLLGAKMVPFAGYQMPLEYAGVSQEHINVRENVGIFDVSHMGEIWIKGPRSFELVQRITSNDVALLAPGKIQYSCFPNEQGGVVDDLLVYMYDREKFLLVVNASRIPEDIAWLGACLRKSTIQAVTIEDFLAAFADATGTDLGDKVEKTSIDAVYPHGPRVGAVKGAGSESPGTRLWMRSR